MLIYIHGGSFTGGSTDERHISGTAYAKKGVIFVAMNYRLGPYGFCAHPQLKEADGTCGNYGLYDQLEAIRWVRRNIAALGGDPHRVTLLGQSAGAMSVDILISSPLCRDWYRGAIMMSGPGLQRAAARPQSIEKVGQFWDQICQNAGAADMNALRQTDARTLYYAWLDACKSDKLSMLYTFPVFDGKLLTKATFNMRTIPKMPKILGMTNADMIPVLVSGLIRRWAHDDKGSPCYAYCFDRNLPATTTAPGTRQTCFMPLAHCKTTGDPLPIRIGRSLAKWWRPLPTLSSAAIPTATPCPAGKQAPPRSCALATPAAWRPSRTAVSLKKHFITKDRYK